MSCLLTSFGSTVMQAELDKLRYRFCIPLSISMRAPELGELPLRPYKELGKISFPIVALECRVRLPLAPFVRRVLNEFLALWEQCLTLCIFWHRMHGWDLNHKELQSYFGVR